MALGTNGQTITTHDIFIPERWSARAQRAREKQLHLASFVFRRDDEIEGFGDTLNTQTISNLSANDKTANTQVTLQTPSETNNALVINKHKEASFLVEDNLRVKSQLNLQREYTEKGSYGVGKQIDTDGFSLYTGLTNSAVGSFGVDLTDDTVLAAWEKLSNLDVPEEDRAWFFTPGAFADLLKLEKFVRTDFKTLMMQGMDIPRSLRGKVKGELYGSPVYITTNVPTGTFGSPVSTGYINLYLHKEAFQLGMQKQIRVQTDYILEYLGHLTVIDAIYGWAVYRADHGVVVRT